MSEKNTCHKCGKVGESFEDNFHHLCFCTGLPKAPEPTEILNEVKADKGILTEEELNKIEIFKYHRNSVSWEVVDEIIASHRNLLSANAELSFKNKELKKENESLILRSTATNALLTSKQIRLLEEIMHV